MKRMRNRNWQYRKVRRESRGDKAHQSWQTLRGPALGQQDSLLKEKEGRDEKKEKGESEKGGRRMRRRRGVPRRKMSFPLVITSTFTNSGLPMKRAVS